MRASRSKDCRVIQYHAANLTFDGAAALRRQILRFIQGIKGPRENPVTRKQIVEWFRATDPEFVERQINFLSETLKIRGLANSLGSHRRFNGRYVYELTEEGEAELKRTQAGADADMPDSTDTPNVPVYEWGGHAFVWARPKEGKWSEYDGTNGLGSGEREFRPCMVSGHDRGRRIKVPGSAYGYELDEFEIKGECLRPGELEADSAPDQAPNAPGRF